jgi:hypothetical protein
VANERLARFRRAVSILKKQGLIPKRIDARKAKPESKNYKGKTLASVVRKYDDIVSGKATALKVSPSEFRKLRKKYSTTQGTHVIVPHAATEKVSKRGREISIRATSGIERVQLDVPMKSIDQFLNDVSKDHARIDAMKRKNEYFGVRLFGYTATTSLYSDIKLLIDSLRHYRTVLSSKSESLKLQRDYLQHLEIVRLSNLNKWEFPSERDANRESKTQARRAKKYRESVKANPKYKEANRKRQAKHRRKHAKKR